MGATHCTNCNESERDNELVNFKNEGIFECKKIINNNINYNKCTGNSKLWNIIRNQENYGTNLQVKKMEALHGPFKFDNTLICDNGRTTVVDNFTLDNGAIYYGQWYF